MQAYNSPGFRHDTAVGFRHDTAVGFRHDTAVGFRHDVVSIRASCTITPHSTTFIQHLSIRLLRHLVILSCLTYLVNATSLARALYSYVITGPPRFG